MTLPPNGKVFYSGQGSEGTNPTGCSVRIRCRGPGPASTAITQNRCLRDQRHPAAPASLVHPRGSGARGNSPARTRPRNHRPLHRTPVWTPGPVMSTGRIQMDTVILPNGKVLALGGSVNKTRERTGRGRQRTLYDPICNTFSSAGVAWDAAVPLGGAAPARRARGEIRERSGQPWPHLAAIEIYTPRLPVRFGRPADRRPCDRPSPGVTRRPERSARGTVLGHLHRKLAHQLRGAGPARFGDPCLRHGAAADRGCVLRGLSRPAAVRER